MSSKRKNAEASSSSTKKPKVLDLTGLPPSISHLTFEQRGTVLEQLLLDNVTSTKTRTLIHTVVEKPDKIALAGLESHVRNLRLQMSNVSSHITMVWDCANPDRDEEDEGRYEGFWVDEEQVYDDGPEVAQALLPFLPLIASLPSDHPAIPSFVSFAVTFELFIAAIEEAFVVQGNPQETDEFADAVDLEILKLIEAEAKRKGEKWDPKKEYVRLVKARDCNGKDKVLCKLPRSIGRLEGIVLGREAARKKEEGRRPTQKKAVGVEPVKKSST